MSEYSFPGKPYSGPNFTVALGQFASGTNMSANVDSIVSIVHDAAARGAQVVTFPEMAVTGYYVHAIKNATQAELTAAEDTIATACAAAHIHCIIGVPHFYSDTEWYNTALVISSSGRRIYRQAKLCPCCEQDGTPGEWAGTFELDGITCGVEICADVMCMEVAKFAALRGAQVLFHISWEFDLSWEHMIPGARALSQTRAQENQMFVVYTNAAQTLIRNEENAPGPTHGGLGGGPNPFQGSHGQSRVVDPNGIVLTEAPVFGEVLLVHQLDMRLAPSIGWGNDTLHHPLFASWWKRGLDMLGPMPLALPDSHKPTVSKHARVGILPSVPSVVDDDVQSTQPTSLRVATAQAITGANVTANVQRMQEFVRQAARESARLVIFPEEAVSSYNTTNIASTPQSVFDAAELALSTECATAGIYCLIGIPRYYNKTHWHNTALLIDPQGTKVYRQAKVYKCCPQDNTPGVWLDTFEIDGIRASLQICFDEFHPEVAKLPTLNGTEILFFLHWEGDPRSEWKMQTYRAMMSGRAYELGIPIVHANAVRSITRHRTD
jgi:predicted amidohydrolase